MSSGIKLLSLLKLLKDEKGYTESELDRALKSSLSEESTSSNSSSNYRDEKICIFYNQGKCRNGESCRFIHGDLCDICNKAMLIPGNAEQNQQHIYECVINQENQIKRQQDHQKEYECEICFDKIVEQGKKFGLLSNCNHKFCLQCIRSWRISATQSQHINREQIQHVRKCPTCRNISFYIIPSDVFVTGRDKEEIINLYKLKLSNIPCKYFEQLGFCKFKESCMYAHILNENNLFHQLSLNNNNHYYCYNIGNIHHNDHYEDEYGDNNDDNNDEDEVSNTNDYDDEEDSSSYEN